MTSLGSIMVIGQAAKFSVAFPLIYHYFGGLRHLMWDRMPEMLETEKVEQSSYVIIGASVGLSAILAVAV
jgi:succinate dehydrogenase (ubiquinone) cytochrome b560 subunit